MPRIEREFLIRAPIEVCFDLARSIDIHMDSTAQTRERAVGGRTSGLIELGESVTWEAVHFGIRQRLTARITEMERPFRFVDEMVSGAFHSFYHVHEFYEVEEGTRMVDIFEYRSPYGWLGVLADQLFVTAYMDRFLTQRNLHIKRVAEAKE